MNGRASELTVGAAENSIVSNICLKKKKKEKEKKSNLDVLRNYIFFRSPTPPSFSTLEAVSFKMSFKNDELTLAAAILK